MQFSKWLKEARLDAGLTQREFATRTNITYVSICGFEKGSRKPSIKSINKIAQFLNVSVADVRTMIKAEHNESNE